MFGKPHDDTDTLDSGVIDGFFGDEAATAKAVEVDELQHRVEQVEAQISSQFTSLATYAQIAQEQVELARSEAKAATERSEQRVLSLIERERADRISSFTGQAPAGSAPDVAARLDAVEHSVAQIRKGLDECLERQKSLADAIALMFDRLAPSAPAAEATEQDDNASDAVVTTEGIVEGIVEDVEDVEDVEVADPLPIPSSFAPPTAGPVIATPVIATPVIATPVHTPLSGPIADLSLEG